METRPEDGAKRYINRNIFLDATENSSYIAVGVEVRKKGLHHD
jgi:hypothetical protein